jgi:hypothetical protein
MPTTSQIITIGTVAVVVGIAGYAIYFDYARRSDPQFRKKLRQSFSILLGTQLEIELTFFQ